MGLIMMAIAFILALINIYLVVNALYFILDAAGYIKKRHRRLVEGSTLFFFVLLIMQAAGQLTFRDVLSLIALAFMAYFYFGYFSDRKSTDT